MQTQKQLPSHSLWKDKCAIKQLKMVMSCTHRFTRVITEVDFGEANIDEQVLHANNPTFVAIFILSHDGHLSITNTLHLDTRLTQVKCAFNIWCFVISVEKQHFLKGELALPNRTGENEFNMMKLTPNKSFQKVFQNSPTPHCTSAPIYHVNQSSVKLSFTVSVCKVFFIFYSARAH